MNNYNKLRSNNLSTCSLPTVVENISENTFEPYDWTGILIAIVIVGLWFISLLNLLAISVLSTSWVWLTACILGRTYLHTGLFILAHDAMHGNLVPSNRSLNNMIGRLTVGIYALLPYDRCSINHTNHHRYTAQIGDPDFHGTLSHPIFWYCKFIREYFSWRSLITFLISMIMLFGGLILIFKVSLINLILFWLVPLVLSSLQLFFFGTYLPHQQVCPNPNFSPRTASNFYSILWSFLSCYNFGHYHWEHHEYPQTPWYRLHKVH
ncbi:MAG: fatty acid desaturase [Pseudanabaena sp. ELA645]|jgi:beta-carotene ketolase (CrtW type)